MTTVSPKVRVRAAFAYLGLGVLMAVASAGDSHAGDTRTLSKFLASCNADKASCRDNLHDYTLAASTQGMICMPKDVSISDAVRQELDWLRTMAAQRDDLNSGSAEDGEWAAISTLYPCAGDTQTAAR